MIYIFEDFGFALIHFPRGQNLKFRILAYYFFPADSFSTHDLIRGMRLFVLISFHRGLEMYHSLNCLTYCLEPWIREPKIHESKSHELKIHEP